MILPDQSVDPTEDRPAYLHPRRGPAPVSIPVAQLTMDEPYVVAL
jgi:hypothetical protein